MAGDSVPFEVTIRMRPGRSVTSMRLLDRKAIAHGCSNPCAMVSTTISPADELKVCATAGLAQGKNVQLATQIALNIVVIGNLMSPHAPRIAFTRHHRCLGDGSCDEKAAGQIARYRIGEDQSGGVRTVLQPTGRPSCVRLISGSLPRLPTRITLFTLPVISPTSSS